MASPRTKVTYHCLICHRGTQRLTRTWFRRVLWCAVCQARRTFQCADQPLLAPTWPPPARVVHEEES